MKTILLIILFTGLSADMFDEMRKVFVEQIEEIADTSTLPITEERDYLLQEREKRDNKQRLRKEKEMQSLQVAADEMQERIATRELLQEEVRRGGNTYLDIIMNKRTNIAKKTKYLGLDRTWTKRANTNGVGTISLSGILLEENILKYHKYIQSKYTFVNNQTYKTQALNRATSQSIYSNKGDKITFSIHTTRYKNPTLYKMVIEYISKEELLSRNKIKTNERFINE